jgi:hypothetical protein
VIGNTVPKNLNFFLFFPLNYFFYVLKYFNVLILKIIFFKYFFDAFQNEKYFELESLLYSHTPPLVSVKMKDGRKQPLLANIKKNKKQIVVPCLL